MRRITWHIIKHAIILSEFVDYMRLSELRFESLQVWARVVNLPYNLWNDAWSAEITKQIDKQAAMVHFDHVGGFLSARVTLDLRKPLRRWILIESDERKSTYAHDI